MRRDMFRPLPICLLGVTLLCDPALGSLTNLLARAVARPVALTNSPIVVTATFINLEPTALRGFCYVDELPSALSVTPLDVQINGQSVTNYTFESGLSGDVYAGHT